MTDETEGVGLKAREGIDKKIYWGGHGANWSLRQVLEGRQFKKICEAQWVAFKRTMFWMPDFVGEEISEDGFVHGAAGRRLAMTELLEHGSLGIGQIELKDDGITYVVANWNFVG